MQLASRAAGQPSNQARDAGVDEGLREPSLRVLPLGCFRDVEGDSQRMQVDTITCLATAGSQPSAKADRQRQAVAGRRARGQAGRRAGGQA